jgi:hypothetical protein
MSFNSSGFTKEGQFFNNPQTTNFNVNTNHPLIQNSQEYIYYKKFVSIHSEDRDFIKYPSASEFEIELPEDLLNVVSLRLVDWTFPANYNTFSEVNSNITMSFKINNPYNPNLNGLSDLLIQKIFEALYTLRDSNFIITIEEGFYNPVQMVTELTNKFNHIVTIKIEKYFNEQAINPDLSYSEQQEYVEALSLFNQAGGYNNFIIVYNNVGQKIWFGNVCDQFTLTNETQVLKNTLSDNVFCSKIKNQFPDFSNWGLPGFLGLTRCNVESVNSTNIEIFSSFTTYNNSIVPRFYYGDVFPGDNGYWLLPNPLYISSSVNWVECPSKINFMGPSYIYMEIEGQNCIDETSPYNVSEFTLTTNATNGIVNSSFAKLAIPATPISQWFDRDSLPYKFYYPPAERMRRFKFKFRYHNGQLVNFGFFNFSFVIEFLVQLPQILRTSKTVKYSPVGL